MTRLESMNDGTRHKRWTEAEWWTQGYEHLWTLSERIAEGHPDMVEPEALGLTSSLLNARVQAKSSQDTVVYLTADSEEELLEVKPEEHTSSVVYATLTVTRSEDGASSKNLLTKPVFPESLPR